MNWYWIFLKTKKAAALLILNVPSYVIPHHGCQGDDGILPIINSLALPQKSTEHFFEAFENVIIAQDFRCSGPNAEDSQNETSSTVILEYTKEGELCKEKPGSFWSTESMIECTQVSWVVII